MKSLFTILIIMLPVFALGQTFYVEPTEKGFEKEIYDALKYKGYKVADNKSEADFIVECLITQTSKFNSMYKGFIRINDKSGNKLIESKEVRKGAVAINGFNAGKDIFHTIGKKYLEDLIKDLPNT